MSFCWWENVFSFWSDDSVFRGKESNDLFAKCPNKPWEIRVAYSLASWKKDFTDFQGRKVHWVPFPIHTLATTKKEKIGYPEKFSLPHPFPVKNRRSVSPPRHLKMIETRPHENPRNSSLLPEIKKTKSPQRETVVEILRNYVNSVSTGLTRAPRSDILYACEVINIY